MALLDVNWTAPLAATAGAVPIGQCLIRDPSGLYWPATAANRALYGRKTGGIAISQGDSQNKAVAMLIDGYITPAQSGLSTGLATWGRVSSTGFIERVTNPTSADDVVCWVETDGSCNCKFGFPFGQLSTTSASSLNQIITWPNWYIDSVAGNDGNDGQTSGTALKSWAGLLLKWGVTPVLKPTGGMLTVNLLANIPSSDPIDTSLFRLAPDSNLLIKGTVSAKRTGSVTTATALSRATSQAWQIADTALGTVNAWTADLNERVRITSGAHAGAMFFVAKDLGSKIARISAPVIPAAPGLAGYTSPTVSSISNGDPYQVDTLTQCYLGTVALMGRSDGASATHPGRVFFQDLHFMSSGSSIVVQQCVSIGFIGCRIDPGVSCSNAAQPFFTDCYINGCSAQQSSMAINAGLVTTVASADAGGQIAADFDALFQGAFVESINGSNLYIGAAAGAGIGVFDSPIDAITLGGADGPVGAMAVTGTVYGLGNAGVGVKVQPGSRMLWDGTNVPSVTGTGGDFSLAGATQARGWDEANGRYTAGTIASTWANLNAAVGGGGFGGAAFCVNANACITKTTGTGGGAAPPAGTITGIASTGAGTGVIANSTSGANVQVKSLIAGSNVTITNNANDITIAAGSGFTPPTGTGFVTVTGGVLDAASLAFPLSIAKGGTNATSFTTSGGVTRYNGTSLVNSANFTEDGSGNATLALSVALGGTPATTGQVRLTQGTTGYVYGGYSATNYPMIGLEANACYIGTTSSFGGGTQVATMNVYASSAVALGLGSATYGYLLGGNFEHWVPAIGSSSGSSPYSTHGDTPITLADADHTLSASEYCKEAIRFTGALTALRTITFPAPAAGSGYRKLVLNMCTGANGKHTYTTGVGATVTPFDNQTTGPTINAAWLWIDSNGVHLASQKFAGW